MDERVADRLDKLADQFDGLKGELVAAAVEMFLSADPADQQKALEAVMKAKVARLFESATSIGVIGGRTPATRAKEAHSRSSRKPSSERSGAGDNDDEL